GAGTSGRLAVLDAAELVPTFNAPAEWFVAHNAGGMEALRRSVEGAEDDAENGAAEIRRHVLARDFVLGLTASGRTPFVLGALASNRKLRGRTLRILREATGLGEPECSAALADAGGDLKVALVHLLSGADTQRSADALAETGGQVRQALRALVG